MLTIAQVLSRASSALSAAGVEDSRLEAEVLLAHARETDRTHLLAAFSEPIPEETVRRFDALLARRTAREPLAYIVGEREFDGLGIVCGQGALIPRPETELLVDLALDDIRRRRAPARIADVGTGSGAIAVAIAAHAPLAHVTAIDASTGALAIARRNVERHGCGDRVSLVHGDLLVDQGTYDIIVANLPYVSEDEWKALAPEIREHEPKEALVPGRLGSEAIERLLREAAAHLARGGMLAAEIGASQAPRLTGTAAGCFPRAQIFVKKDLAGLDRVLVVRASE